MSAVNDLIADLVGAASTADPQDVAKARHLLARAVATIGGTEDGTPVGRADTEDLAALHSSIAALDLGGVSDGDIQAALLMAAGMIRERHTVIEPETGLAVRQPDGGDTGNY